MVDCLDWTKVADLVCMWVYKLVAWLDDKMVAPKVGRMGKLLDLLLVAVMVEYWEGSLVEMKEFVLVG